MPKDTEFNISDDDDNEVLDEQEGEEAEEGEEIEEEEETAEGTDAHRRARGDDVDDPEADPEAEELEEIAGEGHDQQIPRARFNELHRENREMREALSKVPDLISRLQAGDASRGGGQSDTAATLPAFDVKAKRREANKLLLDGEEEKAAEIHDAIDAHLINVATHNALETFTVKQAAKDTETVVATAFEEYPFLDDSKKKTFDSEALDDVLMYADRYEKNGDSRATAVYKAVQRVCPPIAKELGLGKGKRRVQVDDDGEELEENEDGTPRKREKPVNVTGRSVLERLRSQRQKSATVRNARADAAQPPETSRSGVSTRGRIDDIEGLDIEHMSDEDFDKMTDEEKSALRGDKLDTPRRGNRAGRR